jgi:nicotinamidase-related amidase
MDNRWVQIQHFVTKLQLPDNPMTEVCDEVKPTDDDTVIVKQYASAFFGTSLAAMLTAQGVDTIILIGCSTSGCVRASALGELHPTPLVVFSARSKSVVQCCLPRVLCVCLVLTYC